MTWLTQLVCSFGWSVVAVAVVAVVYLIRFGPDWIGRFNFKKNLIHPTGGRRPRWFLVVYTLVTAHADFASSRPTEWVLIFLRKSWLAESTHNTRVYAQFDANRRGKEHAAFFS